MLAAPLLAVVAWRLLGPGAVGYDASYSVVWGDAIRHLHAPDFGAALAPTPHPLANLVGALASVFGDDAPALLMALSYLAFGALGVAAFEAGRRSLGAIAGVAFAAILLTRPLVVGATLQASIDVPFLALVLAAVALELGRERRGASVLALLAVAGLLRPEAWLLSLAYLAWAARGGERPAVARLALIAVGAPLLWLAWDLLLTGDPLFSLIGTQDLAERLERDRGIGDALRDTPLSIRTIIGTGVAWAGLVSGAVALVVAQQRARLPIAVLGVGLAGFLALGVADLPLLTRYLLVPAAMVALLCASGLGAYAWLPPGRLRAAGAVLGAAAVLIVLAVDAPDAADTIGDFRSQARAARNADRSLERVAARAPAGCGPLQTSTYRSVPVLAQRLGVRPAAIRVVLPAQARDGVVFAARPAVVAGDIAITSNVLIAARDLRLPRGFRTLADARWWSVGARC